MKPTKSRARTLFLRNAYLIAAALTLAWMTSGVVQAKEVHFPQKTLHGRIESGGEPLADYTVGLYVSYTAGKHFNKLLGTDTSDRTGEFHIRYNFLSGLTHLLKPVFYILAEKDTSMLASAIGETALKRGVVVTERTTVAIGTAFAQFIDDRKISGNTYGMYNAVKMAANMADPQTGSIGAVLDHIPNADETSTRKTFNSLANIVAGCMADSADCDTLFELSTPPGGPAPTTVLQALANMTKYPSNNVVALFDLSLEHPNVQPTPALTEAPTSWLLFIKFTGGFYSAYDDSNLMSGPGNLVFDQRGFAWINDNYVPTRDLVVSCSGLRVMKFYPWGESFPGSPYFGGGLSGAGFGITLDPRGDIWVGNFGFEAPSCADAPPDPANKIPAPHNSVSLFRPNGQPLSGFDGFTQGHLWWPQGTVSDKQNNIWVANCGNDTVTLFPRGNPWKARNIALPGGQGESKNYIVTLPDEPLIKPFAIAIDPKGRAWVTGNRADWSGVKGDPAGLVYRISPDGSVATLPNPDGDNGPFVKWPMGITGDSRGNMWVSSSDSVNIPCVTPLAPQDGCDPSIVFYPADDGPPAQYRGGGLTIPWGSAVDGNDTLWVFNFGHTPTDIVDANTSWPNTDVSHFCGADESKCPSGLKRGDAISPPTGYVSDALDRITGGGIDPSGNLWLLNNWKKLGPYGPVYNTNPGGNSFVIVPGAAKPIRTPLIGPPRSF
jgi:hypothetical protein